MQCSKLGTGRDTNKIFYNRRNTKGVLLLSKMVYKRLRGLGLGAEPPRIIEHFHLPVLFLSLHFSFTYSRYMSIYMHSK